MSSFKYYAIVVCAADDYGGLH